MKNRRVMWQLSRIFASFTRITEQLRQGVIKLAQSISKNEDKILKLQGHNADMSDLMEKATLLADNIQTILTKNLGDVDLEALEELGENPDSEPKNED